MIHHQQSTRYDDFLDFWKNLDYCNTSENLQNQYMQQSKLLGQYAELNGEVISIFDLKHNKILYISDNYPAVLGYTCDKETFSKWNTFFLFRDLPISQSIFVIQLSQFFKKAIKPLLSNGSKRNVNWTIYNFMRKPPGSERKHTCHICKVLEFDQNGNMEILLVISKDIKQIIKNVDAWWFQMNINNDSVFHYHSDEKKMTNKSLISEREKEILQFIEQGFDSKQISEMLFISPKTVDTHRKNILERVSIRDFYSFFNLSKGSSLY